MKKRLINIILIMTLLFSCVPAKTVQAAPALEIRVGLTSCYYGKNQININNTKITMGYVKDRTFTAEATFTSDNGFTFKPASEYYISLNEPCATYAETLTKKKVYFQSPGKISGAVTGKGEWQVYCGPFESYTDAEEAVKKLQNSGAKKAYILGGSNYRLKLIWGTSEIIIDLDEDMEYPQFEAASKYENMGYFVDLGERVYRGRIEIGRYGKAGLTAVNIVPLEEYVYGVVASEMPEDWPEEALKAQAVCSRSYAVVKAGISSQSDGKAGYKISDSTDSQVYRGVMFEKEACTKAVDSTRGEMVYFNNKAVAAYYFSSGGGSTESSDAVWGVDLPYLMAKADAMEGSFAIKPWKLALTLTELTNRIASYSKTVGPVKDINTVRVSESGRVSLLRIMGENGSLAMQTTSIRNVLGVKGTKMTIVKYGDKPDVVSAKNSEDEKEISLKDSYVKTTAGVREISGSNGQVIVKSASNLKGYGLTAPDTLDEIWIYGIGSGHGVGMSQTGAAGMAEKGYDYKDIIEYYFTGCHVS